MGNHLRFTIRSVAEGIVADELLGPEDDIPATMLRHHERMQAIEAAGGIWVMEITDPDGDMAPMRVSNDPDELVLPVPLSEQTIDQAIEQRRPEGDVT